MADHRCPLQGLTSLFRLGLRILSYPVTNRAQSMKTATDARGLTLSKYQNFFFLSITLVYAPMYFLKFIKEKRIPQSLERATLRLVCGFTLVLRGHHLLRSSLPTSTVLNPFPTCQHPVTPKPSSNFSGVHTLNFCRPDPTDVLSLYLFYN